MPDISVEEAVKQNCQAVLIGDLMRIMADLTPEALRGAHGERRRRHGRDAGAHVVRRPEPRRGRR